jgi:hypothetical protein
MHMVVRDTVMEGRYAAMCAREDKHSGGRRVASWQRMEARVLRIELVMASATHCYKQ